MLICLLVWGCEKDPVPPTPVTIDNIECKTVSYTSSIIQFSITGNTYKVGIEYGIEQDLSNMQILYATKLNGEISLQVENLEQGTEYYYRVFAEDKQGNKKYSSIKNFITLSSSVTTGDATDITTETVVISVSIEGVDINEIGIMYTTDELCKENLQTVFNSNIEGNSFRFEISDLSPGTIYYYKAYIKFQNGTISYGTIKSFQTEEQYLKVSTVMIEASAEEGLYQFDIDAVNVDWEIECNQDWLTIEPMQGNSSAKINLSVMKNYLENKRTANIQIHYLNKTETVIVEQAENNDPEALFTLSTLANCVEPIGNQSCYFLITSNSSWSVVSDQDWCTLQTTSGYGNGIIYYSVRGNNSGKCRIATLTVQESTGTKQHFVLQDMKNNPISGFCNVLIGSYQVWRYWWSQIESPNDWTISCDEDWCKIVVGTGHSGEECQIDMTYNYTSKDRVAQVDVFSGQYSSTALIVQYKYNESSQVISPEIEMIPVEGGSFLLNDISSVSVDSYSIGKYEITQKQWFDVMGYNYSDYRGDDLPITNITWAEVWEFIDKLNNLTGKNYRLPTEAEWEYAAKGGNRSKGYIYSGSNVFNDVGWRIWTNTQTTVFVGKKQPNELGIYDMTGNVGEYCSDWYSYPLEITNSYNPQGPLTGTEKVVKGWGSSLSINKSSMPLTSSSNTIGFRLVLDN